MKLWIISHNIPSTRILSSTIGNFEQFNERFYLFARLKQRRNESNCKPLQDIGSFIEDQNKANEFAFVVKKTNK